jgi:hypothetical protein
MPCRPLMGTVAGRATRGAETKGENMSIVALMQDAAVDRGTGRAALGGRRRAKTGETRSVAPDQPASSTAAIAAGLTRYIPGEAVGLYTAGLPFLLGSSGSLDSGNFTGRWVWAALVAILAVLFGVGVYKAEVEKRGERFRWPPRRTAVIVFAYLAWVVLIPGSPFGEFSWYSPALGALVGLAATGILAAFTLWFGAPES